MKREKSKKDKAKECIESVKTDVEKYFKQFSKLWRDEEELYYGHCWKNTSQYRPFENNVFDIVETAVPILSDNVPAPMVTVKDPRKQPQGEMLKSAIEWVNKDQDFPLLYPDVIRNALTTGTGWIYTYFDQDAGNGEGKILHELLDWRQCKPSGRSRKIEDCDKFRLELYRSKDWLKQKYPKYEEQIDKKKGEEETQDDGERGFEKVDSGAGYAKRYVPQRYTDSDTLKLVITYKKDFSLEEIPEEETLELIQENLSLIEQGQAPDSNKYQDHKKIIEAYQASRAQLMANLELMPDASLEELSAVVDELSQANEEAAQEFGAILLQANLLDDAIETHKILSKENPKGKRLKYPGGYRQIESVGDCILYDGSNKDDHNEIPVTPFYCYRNKSIFGFGMIRNLADSQRMGAVLQFKEYKGLQLVANPAKEVNEASGLTKDDISNEDGAIYMVKEGQPWSVRSVQPGQISEQGRRFVIDRREAMREISGMTDPTRGELPDGRLSEVTVSKTQTQALGRVRLKDRQFQLYSLKRMAKLTASLIIQHWTSEKVLKLEETDGEFQQVIFSPAELQDLEFDIEMSNASMSGVDKDQFNVFASSLLNTGQITFKQFTELVDMPRIEKLRQFAEENDQVKAQAEQMQAQMEEQQKQIIKLKGELDPDLLNSEEAAIFDEMMRQEQLDQLGGVTNDQPPQDIGVL